MTNLIAKVAELRKLEGRRQAIAARQHEMGTPNHSLREQLELEHEMRNAASGLLDVLSKIQAGDAEILGLFVGFMGRFKPDGHLSDVGPGAKITNAKATDCLRRYRDLARLMEDDHAT